MSSPVPPSAGVGAAAGTGRRVLMVTSPGIEPTLSEVATNLATVCAETGQQVAIVTTAGLASPVEAGVEAEAEAVKVQTTGPLWWRNWPGQPGEVATSLEEERVRMVWGPLDPSDLESLLGDTGIPGVYRLDLRYFVANPAQVVVRMPDVLAALREVVDVVILEVPSFTSVHHGEGLAPLTDVVLVVAERETTTVEQVRRTSATLRKLGAPVVGMALTGGLTHTDLWGAESEFEEGEEDGLASGSIHESGPGNLEDPSDEAQVTAPTPVVRLARKAPADDDNAGNGSVVAPRAFGGLSSPGGPTSPPADIQ